MIQAFKLTTNNIGTKMRVYLFQIDDILLDTGPSSASQEVRRIFKEVTIKQVIHTHHHEDHTGNSPWIEKYCNIPQWIHPLGVKHCEKATKLPLYRAVVWHNRKPFHPQALKNSYIQTSSHLFNIVHTPGHAEDHIVLIDEEKGICFTGDLYLHHAPTSNFSFESVPEIIRSIDKTLKYRFKDVYCSHRGYIQGGRKLLEQKRDYLLSLQEEVIQAFLKGKSVNKIRKDMFPKNGQIQYASFFENSPIHTVKSIIQEL